MKYYTIEEIKKIEKPHEVGYETLIVEDNINNIAFFKFVKTKELIEIEELKQKLSDTDYQAIKFAEGQITEEEYQEMKVQRQSWRDRINKLEEMMT